MFSCGLYGGEYLNQPGIMMRTLSKTINASRYLDIKIKISATFDCGFLQIDIKNAKIAHVQPNFVREFHCGLNASNL